MKEENIQLSETEKKIIEVLENLRPHLNSEGGDVEFIKYENEEVYIKLSGACECCPHQSETINNGLLRAMQEQVPEVKNIINVDL